MIVSQKNSVRGSLDLNVIEIIVRIKGHHHNQRTDSLSQRSPGKRQGEPAGEKVPRGG